MRDEIMRVMESDVGGGWRRKGREEGGKRRCAAGERQGGGLDEGREGRGRGKVLGDDADAAEIRNVVSEMVGWAGHAQRMRQRNKVTNKTITQPTGERGAADMSMKFLGTSLS